MYGKFEASLWKNLSTGTAQKSFGAIFCFYDFSLQLIFFSEQPFNRNYSTVDSHTNTVISHAVAYSSRWRRKPWQSLLSCRFQYSVKAIRIPLLKSNLLIGFCRDLRISCNSWFYFIVDMICMLLDMICISKRGINFHPSTSIKSNGITSHYSEQPRSVTLSYKYAVRSDSICFFDEIILTFKLEAPYSVK